MMALCIIFFKDKPPTPPSFTSDVEKEDFKVALKLLRGSKDYLFLCVSFSFFYGSFTILAVILNFLIVPFGLGDPIYSSILSVTPIVSGMVGCIITSIHLKKYQ
jgi:FLVCR family feline leukemia virus subgroup C receptor-related protein